MEAKEALTKAPIFSRLPSGALDAVARAATVRGFEPGELLVREGEEAAEFFLLAEGEADVVRGAGQEERVLNHLSGGDFFGEMAVLDGFPRSASVRATSPCQCLVLTRSDFLPLVATRPEVALAVIQAMSRRLRECEGQLLP